MGVYDKAKAQAQETAGKAKERVGEETGDQRTRANGVGDQAKGKAKKGMENAKQRSGEAFEDAKARMTGDR